MLYYIYILYYTILHYSSTLHYTALHCTVTILYYLHYTGIHYTNTKLCENSTVLYSRSGAFTCLMASRSKARSESQKSSAIQFGPFWVL